MKSIPPAYIIQMTLYGFNYFLGTSKGSLTDHVVWEGLVQNAKIFDDEQTASDFAYAESTMECEILKITYE